MQISDVIADMLTRIRNANDAKHETVDIPASNMKRAIAEILLSEGYIKGYQIIEDGKQGVIRITLKYVDRFHFQGHHDRQTGSQRECRRRSACLCMVIKEGYGYVKNW